MTLSFIIQQTNITTSEGNESEVISVHQHLESEEKR